MKDTAGMTWRLSDFKGKKTGATYRVDPMEFVVHDEWINRPATIIVDPEGIVRFAYLWNVLGRSAHH